MNRRDFVRKTCTACISGSVIAVFASSCQVTRQVNGELVENGLLIPLKDFRTRQNGRVSYHRYIIINHEELLFPICVYRFTSESYAALWMKCTHQGNELQASGDKLQCPAHGSEFNNKGQMTGGPAETDLRSFPLKVMDDKLFIDLRKS